MSTEQTNFRIDSATKQAAYAILEEIGMKPSEAVNMFFKRVVAEEGLPFPARKPTKQLRTAYKEMEEIRRKMGRPVRYTD